MSESVCQLGLQGRKGGARESCLVGVWGAQDRTGTPWWHDICVTQHGGCPAANGLGRNLFKPWVVVLMVLGGSESLSESPLLLWTVTCNSTNRTPDIAPGGMYRMIYHHGAYGHVPWPAGILA